MISRTTVDNAESASRNVQALLAKQKARKERAAGVGVSSSQLTRLHAALHFLADNPVIAGDTPGLNFAVGFELKVDDPDRALCLQCAPDHCS